MPVTVPCGRCIGCRRDYSRQWAVRCVHEAKMFTSNCFITLTFNEDSLPLDGSIRKEHLQKFFKRLRKRLSSKGIQIRHFACGEYGERNQRPHYHALIFGYDFPDKKPHTKTPAGHIVYKSAELAKVWPYGYNLIGDVTFESAAYVARYVMKKRKGKPDEIDPKTGLTNEEHYLSMDEETGELINLEPEFCLMSRGSSKNEDVRFQKGIGYSFYQKYKGDIKNEKDFLTIRGAKYKIPKYYDNIVEHEDLENLEMRKKKRRKAAKQQESDNISERLAVKEIVKKEQFKQLKRGYEEDET